MAKRNRTVKQTNVQGPQGNGVSFEHQESFDDNILPDVGDLERLHAMDSEIMSWIKETTSKEQKSRHDFNSRKIGLFESSQRKSFTMDIIQVIAAFLIIVLGMGFSYLLLIQKQIITSTIFAGSTIIFAANAILKFRRQAKQSDDVGKNN